MPLRGPAAVGSEGGCTRLCTRGGVLNWLVERGDGGGGGGQGEQASKIWLGLGLGLELGLG